MAFDAGVGKSKRHDSVMSIRYIANGSATRIGAWTFRSRMLKSPTRLFL